MKITLIVLCLLLAVSFTAGDRGKWRKTPYTCRIKTDQGKYCFGRLYKDSGNAWSGADSMGDIVYFNLCGDLSNEAEASATPGCDPTAAACLLTADGTYINAGRPDDDSLALSVEDNSTIQFNYTNGDACPSGGNYQTIIQLSCADDQDLLITNVNYNSTTCQVLVQGVSEYACPRQGHWGRGDGKEGHGAPFFVFLLPILCCCCACLCIARCCRRRRCQRQQQTQANYSVVPQEEPTQQQQQPVAVPQPYIIPTQFQPQYFQPNPYYVYVPQYGNPAVPAPQPPVTAPVAPIIPLEENTFEMRETQLDTDEKIARDLQAKFDNE